MYINFDHSQTNRRIVVETTSHPALGAIHTGNQPSDHLGRVPLAVNRHAVVPKFIVLTGRGSSDNCLDRPPEERFGFRSRLTCPIKPRVGYASWLRPRQLVRVDYS